MQRLKWVLEQEKMLMKQQELKELSKSAAHTKLQESLQKLSLAPNGGKILDSSVPLEEKSDNDPSSLLAETKIASSLEMAILCHDTEISMKGYIFRQKLNRPLFILGAVYGSLFIVFLLSSTSSL
mmetsp:Transcript_15991/g.39428  ORF Transcript_15991/g.39428 Transcript_15991/m.39428 type:complete len:125 (+) Transcript_15991:1003-1377(+)